MIYDDRNARSIADVISLLARSFAKSRPRGSEMPLDSYVCLHAAPYRRFLSLITSFVRCVCVCVFPVKSNVMRATMKKSEKESARANDGDTFRDFAGVVYIFVP